MGGGQGRKKKAKKRFSHKKKKKESKKTFFHVKNPSRTCMLCCFCYLKEGKYTKPLTKYSTTTSTYTHEHTACVSMRGGHWIALCVVHADERRKKKSFS